MQGLLQRNLHQFILWKVAPSRMLVLQVGEWMPIWGKVLLFAHRQVDEQPSKRSEKNDDKSAVAMLKKGDWHERGPVTDQGHDRPGQPGKKGDNKLERRSSKHRSSNARQLGCVFQDMTRPKSTLRKSTDMQKPIQRVKFTKAIARHTKIRDQNPSLGYICSGEPHQRSPNAPKFEDRSQEETEWKEQGAREAGWKLAKSVLKLKEHERATFFSPSENRCLPASTLKTWGTRICCGLRSVDAYDQQKGLEWCWNGYFDEIAQSYDSHNRQWRSADAWRGYSVCQRVGYIFDFESPQKHASSFVAWKGLRWKRIFLRVDQRSKTTSHSKRDSDTMQHGELRSYRGSRLVNEFFLWFSSFNFNDTFKTGDTLFYIFLKLVFFTHCSNNKWQ